MLELNHINKRSIERLKVVNIDVSTNLYSPKEGKDKGSWFSIPDHWKEELELKNKIIENHTDVMIQQGHPISVINAKVSQLLNYSLGQLEELVQEKLLYA
jgi:hypothetical protein